MLAHHQGALLNVAQFARSLGVDTKTARGCIDLLVDLLLVRRLQPWHANVGKRLVKSPKVYVRDSGLVHALLGIGDKDTIVSHPVVGASWEGFVVEQVLAAAPKGTAGHFNRTSAGAEIDLLLHLPDGELWAIDAEPKAQDPHARQGAVRELNSGAGTAPAGGRRTSGPLLREVRTGHDPGGGIR